MEAMKDPLETDVGASALRLLQRELKAIKMAKKAGHELQNSNQALNASGVVDEKDVEEPVLIDPQVLSQEAQPQSSVVIQANELHQPCGGDSQDVHMESEDD